MTSGRLEAFSDGVLAILITLMAFHLEPPKGGRFSDLDATVPHLLAFTLSFVFLAIYWNNHHHLLRATDRIDGGVMWANMGLLFFLTLIPEATDWLGAHHGSAGPAVLYGIVGFCAGAAYTVLVRAIIRANPGSAVAIAIGRDRKGLASLVLYGVGAAVSLASSYAGLALYVVVSIMWLVPDRRLTEAINR